MQPGDLYTNENGVIKLVEMSSDLWKVEWTKWPNVTYEKDLPDQVSETDISSQYFKVKSMHIDEKCGCIRVHT